MSDDLRDDSFAEKLEATKWDYTQSEDRRFLLEPIGEFFGTFRWDGKPEPSTIRKKIDGDDHADE